MSVFSESLNSSPGHIESPRREENVRGCLTEDRISPIGQGVLMSQSSGSGCCSPVKLSAHTISPESPVLYDLELNNQEIDLSKQYIVDWCKEAYSTEEYGNRIIAAKKILNCYKGGWLLDLSDLGLTTLPNLNLPEVSLLSLQNNQLKELPAIFNLPKLGGIYLKNNKLKQFPAKLNLLNLVELELEDNNIEELPDGIDLSNLQKLFLQNNKLKKLPAKLNLSNLEELGLEGNNIEELPDGIDLSNLQKLFLQNNKLKRFPAKLNLSNLEELGLEANNLTELPDDLNLPNLQKLFLKNNQLKKLPARLNLANLKELGLEGNKIEELPDGIDLSNLQKLFLQNNKLKKFPAKLNLSNLEELGLEGNNLTELPDDLNLLNLEKLFLKNNQLKKLPAKFNLPNLKELGLEGNNLTELPDDLNLSNLEKLFLQNNPELAQLSFVLAKCMWLTQIDITDTKIEPYQRLQILTICQNFNKIYFLLHKIKSSSDSLERQKIMKIFKMMLKFKTNEPFDFFNDLDQIIENIPLDFFHKFLILSAVKEIIGSINDREIKEKVFQIVSKKIIDFVENINKFDDVLFALNLAELIDDSEAKYHVFKIISNKISSIKINKNEETPNIAVLSNGEGITTPYVIKSIEQLAGKSVQRIDFTLPANIDKNSLFEEIDHVFKWIDQTQLELPDVSRAEAFITVVKSREIEAPISLKIINEISKMARELDCIILPGGEDIPPIWYTQVDKHNDFSVDHYRTIIELTLIHEARHKGIPIMGICRGHQIIYVYQGKKLEVNQNKYSGAQKYTLIDQSQQGLIANLFEEGVAAQREHSQGVNIDEVQNEKGDLTPLAIADKLVYASESKYGVASPVITTQFHPEMPLNNDYFSKKNQKFFHILYQSAVAHKVKKFYIILRDLSHQLEIMRKSMNLSFNS